VCVCVCVCVYIGTTTTGEIDPPGTAGTERDSLRRYDQRIDPQKQNACWMSFFACKILLWFHLLSQQDSFAMSLLTLWRSLARLTYVNTPSGLARSDWKVEGLERPFNFSLSWLYSRHQSKAESTFQHVGYGTSISCICTPAHSVCGDFKKLQPFSPCLNPRTDFCCFI
jgi:hypothetical protein